MLVQGRLEDSSVYYVGRIALKLNSDLIEGVPAMFPPHPQ